MQTDHVRSLKDAAAQLNLSVYTLQRLASEGKIKILHLSARRRGVRESEIYRFLSACEGVAA